MGKFKHALLLLLFPFFATAHSPNVEIFYTWSPMMPLSVQGIAEIKEICDRHQFICHFILDPYQSASHIDSELQAYAVTQKMPDFLLQRGALNHYPAFIVLKDKQVMGNIHLGYVVPEMLEQLILERL